MKNYDPDQTTMVFAGLLISQGFAEDSFITISQPDDTFTHVTGTDGEVTRTKSNQMTCEVTIKLMQTSKHNAELSAIHNLDIRMPNGAGVAPLIVRDRQGTMLFESAEAWIASFPEEERGKTPTPREWKFIATRPNRVVG